MFILSPRNTRHPPTTPNMSPSHSPVGPRSKPGAMFHHTLNIRYTCPLLSNLEIYTVNLSTPAFDLFFSILIFFDDHLRITGLPRKGEGISLTRRCHFHLLHRHFRHCRAITAEISSLHIGSSRTRT